jgi:hypothetical protein
VPNSLSPYESDPSVAVASDGTVYLGAQSAVSSADGANTIPEIAVSHDGGESWTNITNVGAALGIKNVQFPEVIAGDGDRAAFAFLGSTTGGDDQVGGANGFHGRWDLYVATTYDGGATWTTVDATPTDPVQRGCISLSGFGSGSSCRNLLDFNDITVDGEGRVLVAYADGCTGACVTDPNSETRKSSAVIARQRGALGLNEANDPASVATTLAIADGSQQSAQYSDAATIKGSLTDATGTPLAGRPVDFTLSGPGGTKTWSATTNDSGVATKDVTADLDPGTYDLTASYAGEDGFDASTGTGSFDIAVDDSLSAVSVAGRASNRTLTATLADADTPSSGLADRSVTFFAGDHELATGTTDADGNSTVSVPDGYNIGRHDYRAVFGGDAYYTPSDASTTTDPDATRVVITGGSATAGQYTDPARFQAALKDIDGGALAGEVVTFHIAGGTSSTTFDAVTDADGVASKTIDVALTPGSYTVEATYGGRGDLYSGSTDSGALAVSREDTSLLLTTATAKGKRTLTATLSDADAATNRIAGRVISFTVDGTAIGTAKTNSNGVATLDVPTKYVGGHHAFEGRFDGANDSLYKSSQGRVST